MKNIVYASLDKTNGSLVVVYSTGDTNSIGVDHPQFNVAVSALNNLNYVALQVAIDSEFTVEGLEWNSDDFEVIDKVVFYKGIAIHNVVCEKILKYITLGISVEPLYKFLGKLLKNPSKNSQEQLYKFMEQNHLPITPDGDCLLYKKVNADYTDCYTSSIDNSIGKELKMPRSEVSDDPHTHCSNGYHCACYDYANTFMNGRMMIVTVDPRDVVSVPYDLNQKIRCCKYKVVNEVHITERNSSEPLVDEVYTEDLEEASEELDQATIPFKESTGRFDFGDRSNIVHEEDEDLSGEDVFDTDEVEMDEDEDDIQQPMQPCDIAKVYGLDVILVNRVINYVNKKLIVSAEPTFKQISSSLSPAYISAESIFNILSELYYDIVDADGQPVDELEDGENANRNWAITGLPIER